MIDFMVIAAPRSGTTWAANWLTTDTTLCLHDPLWQRHYTELDRIKSERTLGIACTGIALFPEWVNAHPARKVILHRDLGHIDRSLHRIGFPRLTAQWDGALDAIEGEHHDWRDLFDNPAPIYEYLLQRPFDAERHRRLRDMRIVPRLENLSANPEASRRLMDELRSA